MKRFAAGIVLVVPLGAAQTLALGKSAPTLARLAVVIGRRLGSVLGAGVLLRVP